MKLRLLARGLAGGPQVTHYRWPTEAPNPYDHVMRFCESCGLPIEQRNEKQRGSLEDPAQAVCKTCSDKLQRSSSPARISGWDAPAEPADVALTQSGKAAGTPAP